MKKRSLLRVLRAAQIPKVSQSQLARKAGMGLFRYWQIENGEGPDPSTDEQKAIAIGLSVTVSDIAWAHLEAKARAS